MRDLCVNERVRLLKGIPELQLNEGSVGTVCGRWCSPMTAYEVHFTGIGADLRTLIMPELLVAVDEDRGARGAARSESDPPATEPAGLQLAY